MKKFDQSQLSEVSLGGSPFRFTGEQLDDNGLLYLRARYYHPELGVFTGLDPIENLNRYQYVDGNVVNMVDPSGEEYTPPQPQQDSCYQTSVCDEVRPCEWIWRGSGPPTNCPPMDYRLTDVDWVGLGLVEFDETFSSFGDRNCEIALLALDILLEVDIYRTAPRNTIRWIAGHSGNTFLPFIAQSGSSMGAGYNSGRIYMWAAQIPRNFVQPSGLHVLLHEMAHGIDESENFTSSGKVNRWGYSHDGTTQWTYSGNTDFGSGRGPANNYITLAPGVHAPWEDFANTFTSVVIEVANARGLTRSLNGNNLSSIIGLFGDVNMDGVVGVDELGPVGPERHASILQLLGYFPDGYPLR